MMDLHQAMMDVDLNYAKTDLAQTDPAVRAALEDMILDHERRWLSEPRPSRRPAAPTPGFASAHTCGAQTSADTDLSGRRASGC